MAAIARLALYDVAKRFGTVEALAPLSIALPPGSVHGILGENGAGKSTLVRIVSGALAPDAGEVRLDGKHLPPGEPRAARAAGVGVVHQHFTLIGALSVAENLALGGPETHGAVLSPRRLATWAEALADQHGVALGDPARPCRELPVGAQARLEILKALAGRPSVLLLDEPTAVLTPPEVEDLFANLQRMRESGMLIVLITHKLEEALAVCSTVSVLRGGRLVITVAARDTSARELAALMIGVSERPATEVAPTPSADLTGSPSATRAEGAALAVSDLETRDPGRVALSRVTFTVSAGEICGIAGVDGNGQEELAAAIYGLADRTGDVAVGTTRLPVRDVRAAQQAGVVLIPADRQRDGLALGLSVWENALLATPLLERFTHRAKLGMLDTHRARDFAAALARAYRIVLASLEQPAASLSGGNQQRLVLARALAVQPSLIVALNPTRGLDIAATARVHALLREAALAGAGVVLISTDLDELTSLCERIFALYRGELRGPVGRDERARLGALMAGLAA